MVCHIWSPADLWQTPAMPAPTWAGGGVEMTKKWTPASNSFPFPAGQRPMPCLRPHWHFGFLAPTLLLGKPLICDPIPPLISRPQPAAAACMLLISFSPAVRSPTRRTRRHCPFRIGLFIRFLLNLIFLNFLLKSPSGHSTCILPTAAFRQRQFSPTSCPPIPQSADARIHFWLPPPFRLSLFAASFCRFAALKRPLEHKDAVFSVHLQWSPIELFSKIRFSNFYPPFGSNPLSISPLFTQIYLHGKCNTKIGHKRVAILNNSAANPFPDQRLTEPSQQNRRQQKRPPKATTQTHSI
jgi:hypothetical protein